MTGTFHEDVFTFMIISRLILRMMRTFLDRIVKKQKHIFYVKYFFSKIEPFMR
jgi:hypothetical protein